MSKSKVVNESDPVVIKKYANRRLYNTETSSYITLDLLSQMTREGREFTVVDAKSGEDITHNVLTQIIMEEEQRGTNMLPVNFLRQLISMYGDSMQSMVPQYLESSMDAFPQEPAAISGSHEGRFWRRPIGRDRQAQPADVRSGGQRLWQWRAGDARRSGCSTCTRCNGRQQG